MNSSLFCTQGGGGCPLFFIHYDINKEWVGPLDRVYTTSMSKPLLSEFVLNKHKSWEFLERIKKKLILLFPNVNRKNSICLFPNVNGKNSICLFPDVKVKS